jgi:hypothetical protein
MVLEGDYAFLTQTYLIEHKQEGIKKSHLIQVAFHFWAIF